MRAHYREREQPLFAVLFNLTAILVIKVIKDDPDKETPIFCVIFMFFAMITTLGNKSKNSCNSSLRCCQ